MTDSTPFDRVEADVADALWREAAAVLHACRRSTVALESTGEIWRSLAGVVLDDARISAGMAAHYGVPSVPPEEVTRARRSAAYFAGESPEKRAARYADLEARDADRARAALARAVAAQAAACLAGQAHGWIRSEAVCAAAYRLERYAHLADSTVALERLRGAVRDRVLELAAGLVGEIARAA